MNQDAPSDVQSLMLEIGRRARAAGAILALAPTEAKNAALTGAARATRARVAEIKRAN